MVKRGRLDCLVGSGPADLECVESGSRSECFLAVFSSTTLPGRMISVATSGWRLRGISGATEFVVKCECGW